MSGAKVTQKQRIRNLVLRGIPRPYAEALVLTIQHCRQSHHLEHVRGSQILEQISDDDYASAHAAIKDKK